MYQTLVDLAIMSLKTPTVKAIDVLYKNPKSVWKRSIQLFAHQERAVNLFMVEEWRWLLAHTMGAGKSASAIALSVLSCAWDRATICGDDTEEGVSETKGEEEETEENGD